MDGVNPFHMEHLGTTAVAQLPAIPLAGFVGLLGAMS
jgi:hypothetical protein